MIVDNFRRSDSTPIPVRPHNVPIATQAYALAIGGPLAARQMRLAKTASPVASVAPGG